MDVRSLFKRVFAHAPPRVIRVPASLELLGGHTESHQGLVFSVAVDRHAEIGFVPRNDGRIELVADRPEKRLRLWARECEPGMVPGWAAPVAAVVRQLGQMGGGVRGFNAAWTSDIPDEAGFSEHATLVIAAALALRRMFPYAIGETGLREPPAPDRRGELPTMGLKECMHFAGFCRAAERGMLAGEDLDHGFIAPLTNRAYGLSQLDCLHRTIERHSLPGELVPVFCDTGLRDPGRGLHRARFVAAGRRAAKTMGLRFLRSLAVGDVRRMTSALSPHERGAARFVAGECARVVAAEQAMRAGEITQFGECLFQSHAAAQAEAGITAPELDLLVAAAREHPACIGARFTGSGSDGGTLNLVAWTQTDSFIKSLRAQFRSATGRELTCLQLKPVAGVFGWI